MKTVTTLAAVIVLAGCASKPPYVSPLPYEAYSCEQLQAESGRIKQRAYEVANEKTGNEIKNAAALGIALVAFWPAMLAIGSDGSDYELKLLQGNDAAIRQVMVAKGCAAPAAAK